MGQYDFVVFDIYIVKTSTEDIHVIETGRPPHLQLKHQYSMNEYRYQIKEINTPISFTTDFGLSMIVTQYDCY